jgi:hypothetical protein
VGARLSEEEKLASDLWPFAVHGILAGRSIGLVFLGGSSDKIDALVRDGVGEAGGSVNAVVALREPLDTTGISSQATGTRYTALASNPSLVREFGVRVGRQLVSGGQLLERVHTRLLSSYDGQLGKLEGLVVVRNDPTGMSPPAAKATTELESGVIEGVALEGIPVVGVELSSTEPSQVPWYKAENLASVDDIETIAGRTALALALAGDHGAYGAKSTADALLPSVVSTPIQH